jgi:3-phenylpropionate/trans-cinnamate dioxygenase ferredoxin reductase subunit
VPKIVIVGAGLAGLRTAEELRRAGFTGGIELLGAEQHPPYDRPPLSKDVLRGGRPAESLYLSRREALADAGITLRTGCRAERLEPAGRLVHLTDGTSVAYDDLVVATGVEARRLPGADGVPGVFCLRSLEDGAALRDRAAVAEHVLVVGAGFVGCEVAASLRATGVAVTMIDMLPAPLARAFGVVVGELVADLHRESGVDVRGGVGLSRVLGPAIDGDAHGELAGTGVTSVELTNGDRLAVDTVVVGIGADPAVRWLAGSGIRLGDGVECDAGGRTSLENVWAVGDVACWPYEGPFFTGRARTEHWIRAGEQAAVVARDIVDGSRTALSAPPYVWSDQYDRKIQAIGWFSPSDEVRILRREPGRFLAAYARTGRLTGVVGCGWPADVMRLRAAVLTGVPMTDVGPAGAPGHTFASAPAG